jgi:protein-S-isoprenylcysteine O-methyltransferase Ste14
LKAASVAYFGNHILPAATFAVVILCWVAFIAFFLRRRPTSPPDEKRNPRSILGLVLQAVSFLTVWLIRRPALAPIAGDSSLAAALSCFAIASAISSVVLVMAAVRTLGKEWSLTARVVEGHELATKGPYALVRHPIYTGMLGMLLATGIALSHWAALPVAILLYLAGTTVRVRSEEALLREAFGNAFEEYARRVPALVPGLY